MNERNRIAMATDEVHRLLSDSRKMQLGTTNPDGSVHLVTMFYVLVDGQIAFWTYRSSQKARNLARDPRVTCLVETGDQYFELRGAQVRGRVRCIEDQQGVADIGARVAAGLMGIPDELLADYVAQAARKRVAYLVEPGQVVSWDHRKLTGGE